eukprot:m.103718 g.103718  ORF g.103718 m.103718 type:complete len:72 (+) comp20887_c0_seq1:244-459(+)
MSACTPSSTDPEYAGLYFATLPGVRVFCLNIKRLSFVMTAVSRHASVLFHTEETVRLFMVLIIERTWHRCE